MNINAAVIKMQGRSRMDAAASGALGSAASSQAGGACFSLANAGSAAGRGSGFRLGAVVRGARHHLPPAARRAPPRSALGRAARQASFSWSRPPPALAAR